MNSNLYHYDLKVLKSNKAKLVCGCDETGRGSWASSLVAAAVILKYDDEIIGLNDSKKLTDKTRKRIDQVIKDNSICWGIYEITAEEIDKRGITWANSHAMHMAAQKAVESIGMSLQNIDIFIIDQSPCKSLNPHIMMPKADSTSACVAAASVLAKNYRDNLMIDLDIQYPEYKFLNHKGYINQEHIKIVNEFGLLQNVHRKSFKVSGYNKPKQISAEDFFNE
jgi:ribonuclease HII